MWQVITAFRALSRRLDLTGNKALLAQLVRKVIRDQLEQPEPLARRVRKAQPGRLGQRVRRVAQARKVMLAQLDRPGRKVKPGRRVRKA